MKPVLIHSMRARKAACGLVGLSACVILLGACATKSISPEDEAAWQTARASPFSIRAVRDYMDAYPAGAYSDQARQIIEDEKTIERWVTDGMPERRIVPAVLWPAIVKGSMAGNSMRGRTVLEEERGGYVSAQTVFGRMVVGFPTSIAGVSDAQFHGPYIPCGHRSVFIVTGQVDNLYGVPRDPLRLVYLMPDEDAKENGKMGVLGGRGHARDERGRVVRSWPE